jgi:hypothetical protein
MTLAIARALYNTKYNGLKSLYDKIPSYFDSCRVLVVGDIRLHSNWIKAYIMLALPTELIPSRPTASLLAPKLSPT